MAQIVNGDLLNFNLSSRKFSSMDTLNKELHHDHNEEEFSCSLHVYGYYSLVQVLNSLLLTRRPICIYFRSVIEFISFT